MSIKWIEPHPVWSERLSWGQLQAKSCTQTSRRPQLSRKYVLSFSISQSIFPLTRNKTLQTLMGPWRTQETFVPRVKEIPYSIVYDMQPKLGRINGHFLTVINVQICDYSSFYQTLFPSWFQKNASGLCNYGSK